MKTIRFTFLALALLLCTNFYAQSSNQAKNVLDKVSKVLEKSGGASANFSVISSQYGNTKGTIFIKGKKFKALTPQGTIWFDGKTQWTYMKKTNEVNISTPNEAQRMSMNPYSFMTIYKNGYQISMKASTNYNIYLKAIHPARSLQEIYITVNKRYQPQKIQFLQNGKWVTINITNIRVGKHPDKLFHFNAKETDKAEIIDLR